MLNSASSFPKTLPMFGDARAASTTRHECARRFDPRTLFFRLARASAHGCALIHVLLIFSSADAHGFFAAVAIGATSAVGIVCYGAIRIDIAIGVVMTLGRSRRRGLPAISLASGEREGEEQHHSGESIGQLRSAHPDEVSSAPANVNRRCRSFDIGSRRILDTVWRRQIGATVVLTSAKSDSAISSPGFRGVRAPFACSAQDMRAHTAGDADA